MTWAPAPKVLVIVVAGAGFPAHGEGRSIIVEIGALQADAGTLLHHRLKRILDDCNQLMRVQALSRPRRKPHVGFVGRFRSQLQLLDIGGGQPHAVIDDDAHQRGESIRAVARTADGGRQRRHQSIERPTLLFPFLKQIREGVFLGDDPDTDVLLVLFACC